MNARFFRRCTSAATTSTPAKSLPQPTAAQPEISGLHSRVVHLESRVARLEERMESVDPTYTPREFAVFLTFAASCVGGFIWVVK